MKTSIQILAILLGILFTCNIKAQSYKTSVGFKAGAEYGLTVKKFISKSRAVDFQLLNRPSGYTGNINLHFSKETKRFRDLSLYYGTGVGYSILTNSDKNTDAFAKSNKMLAINGILGAEYYIQEIKVNVALEYLPRLEMFSNEIKFNNFPVGLSIRYCIN